MKGRIFFLLVLFSTMGMALNIHYIDATFKENLRCCSDSGSCVLLQSGNSTTQVISICYDSGRLNNVNLIGFFIDNLGLIVMALIAIVVVVYIVRRKNAKPK